LRPNSGHGGTTARSRRDQHPPEAAHAVGLVDAQLDMADHRIGVGVHDPGPLCGRRRAACATNCASSNGQVNPFPDHNVSASGPSIQLSSR
jgi:hypothetical protein